MINEENAKWFCCEDISKIYGYAEAVADNENMWHCHHCLGLAYTKEQLKAKDLYYKRPASELMFVTKSQHKMLHWVTYKHTDEAKRKMGEANRGKHRSEETKRKLSEALKGKYNTKLSKAVYQYTKDGQFITSYPSMTEAERQTGVSHGDISYCCRGKLKTAGGYCWRFAE